MLKRTDNDLWHTALHEAGHAIAAIAERKALSLDQDHLVSASIVPTWQEEPKRPGWYAVEGGSFCRKKVNPILCDRPEHLDGYVKRGHDKNRLLDICRWNVIVNLAGPAATAISKGYINPTDPWEDGGAQDVAQALNSLKAVFHLCNKPRCSGDDALKILERIQRKTETYLREQWDSVADVARGLKAATKLSGYTIEATAAQRWKDHIMHGSMSK